MDESTRVKFDVAWALAVVSPNERLPDPFPEALRIGSSLERILDDCVDPASIKRTSCIIKTDIPRSKNYVLPIGTDHLTLKSGGKIFIGGSGVTIQLYDEKVRRP